MISLLRSRTLFNKHKIFLPMVRQPNRPFFDKLKHDIEGLEEVDELKLMQQINRDTNVVHHDEKLEFDLENRMIIYDGLAQNLMQRFGVIQLGTSLAGLYLWHSTILVPGLETYYFDMFKSYGGLSWFTLVNTMLAYQMFANRVKVNRMFLY